MVTSNLLLKLSVVPFKQPAKRQVFIEIRPVESKRRNLDVVQLLRRAASQPWIFRGWKTNLPTAYHSDNDEAVHMFCRTRAVSQSIHSTSLLSSFYFLPQGFAPLPIHG